MNPSHYSLSKHSLLPATGLDPMRASGEVSCQWLLLVMSHGQGGRRNISQGQWQPCKQWWSHPHGYGLEKVCSMSSMNDFRGCDSSKWMGSLSWTGSWGGASLRGMGLLWLSGNEIQKAVVSFLLTHLARVKYKVDSSIYLKMNVYLKMNIFQTVCTFMLYTQFIDV